MTVGAAGRALAGRRLTVVSMDEDVEGPQVELHEKHGVIATDLRAGVSTTRAERLKANSGLCGQGVKIVGDGFYVEEGDSFDADSPCIRSIINARDVLSGSLGGRPIIDFFELSEEMARKCNPAAYQKLLNRVKPLRDKNRRKSIREIWWRFAWERPVVRKAIEGLDRYFVTLSTSKHRFFVAVEPNLIWDGALFAIASDDWNAHRKNRQAEHEVLTLTGIYNVLDNLKAGEELTPKERTIHDQGLVSILKQLHDELDLAVLEAYGWNDLVPLQEVVNGNALPRTVEAEDRDEAIRRLDEALLERLVTLNAERVAEERRGLVRGLRPELQQSDAVPAEAQEEIALGEAIDAVPKADRRPWPKTLSTQIAAVAEILAAARGPLTEPGVGAHFKARGPWRRRLSKILEILVTLGNARREGDSYHAIRGAAAPPLVGG